MPTVTLIRYPAMMKERKALPVLNTEDLPQTLIEQSYSHALAFFFWPIWLPLSLGYELVTVTVISDSIFADTSCGAVKNQC